MSAITDKMEAILKASGEKSDKSRNHTRTLTVRNEAISPDRSGNVHSSKESLACVINKPSHV